MRGLAVKFGMSDNGLKKRCKRLGLVIPNNSYRMKKYLERQKKVEFLYAAAANFN
jgi:hypothetical protein